MRYWNATIYQPLRLLRNGRHTDRVNFALLDIVAEARLTEEPGAEKMHAGICEGVAE
jgi:hypothetical protein